MAAAGCTGLGPFSRLNNRVLISQTNLAFPSLFAVMVALFAVLASPHQIVTAGPSGAALGDPKSWVPPTPGPVPCAWTVWFPGNMPERCGLADWSADPLHPLTCRRLSAYAHPIHAATAPRRGPELDPLGSGQPVVTGTALAPRGAPRSGWAA